MFTFELFLHVTQGRFLSDKGPGFIEHFLTDSRKLYYPKASVFIAIKGDRHDGHQYLGQLFDKGVRNFIIENEHVVPNHIIQASSVLVVENTVKALQEIAAFHRRQFDFPVIAVTGSNGKTIIKEWLGQLLESKFKVVKSPKSYNSQIGVPLSVLQMSAQNNLAIFEAGISLPGEMEKLQHVIDPTIGIFTNIGSAHDEGFCSREAKALEKWRLFKDSSTAIFCEDHLQVKQTKPEHIHSFTWGKSEHADIKLLSHTKEGFHTEINLIYNGKAISLTVSFNDDASLGNVMYCITLMFLLGYQAEEIQSALKKLTVVAMRLELKKGINNSYLVDDSYNNDLGGLQVAIDFFKSQPGVNRKIILSDILQSGLDEKELCNQLHEILDKNQIDTMIGIGPVLKRNASVFSEKSIFYDSTEHFLRELKPDQFANETILVKGARDFSFEKISYALSEKIHRTILEINLDALIHNLNFYRSKIHDGVKLMVMVKAAAYGNGSFEIANLLEFSRVDYLAVAYADEGMELRKKGIELPIMVMNVAVGNFGNIIKYNLEPEIYSLGQLEHLCEFVSKEETSINIHIKVDSGMHRLGFEEKHIERLLKLLKENQAIKVVSIFSHLAGADEESLDSFSHTQLERFLLMAENLEKSLGIKTVKHILNSAGILRFPDYQLDMVRLGIGLYGFEAGQQEQDELQPVSVLKTVISQIKHIQKGETIGYGRKGMAIRDTKIATIAIGYADGFSRAFSNGRISLMVKGKQAPVIGNVCMDMSMLDVTGIDAKEGDEVIVFGENPTIKQLADAIDTIPYEILTSISGRVSRVFYTS